MGIPGSQNGVTLVPHISGHMAIFRFLKLPFWLVVWNMSCSFNIYWEQWSQLTFIFFRGFKPPSSIYHCLFQQWCSIYPQVTHVIWQIPVKSPGANQLPRWVCHQNFATKFWWRLSQCSNNVVSFLVYGVIFVALKIILGYHNFAVLCVFLREHLISRQPHTYFPAISLSLERFFLLPWSAQHGFFRCLCTRCPSMNQQFTTTSATMPLRMLLATRITMNSWICSWLFIFPMGYEYVVFSSFFCGFLKQTQEIGLF